MPSWIELICATLAATSVTVGFTAAVMYRISNNQPVPVREWTLDSSLREFFEFFALQEGDQVRVVLDGPTPTHVVVSGTPTTTAPVSMAGGHVTRWMSLSSLPHFAIIFFAFAGLVTLVAVSRQPIKNSYDMIKTIAATQKDQSSSSKYNEDELKDDLLQLMRSLTHLTQLHLHQQELLEQVESQLKGNADDSTHHKQELLDRIKDINEDSSSKAATEESLRAATQNSLENIQTAVTELSRKVNEAASSKASTVELLPAAKKSVESMQATLAELNRKVNEASSSKVTTEELSPVATPKTPAISQTSPESKTKTSSKASTPPVTMASSSHFFSHSSDFV
ncbi:hypothetical protein ACLMJK_004662 [Lecanora helva]